MHGLRRQYDKVMGEKKTALSRLSNLQDSVRSLTHEAGLAAPGGTDGMASASSAAASRASSRPVSAVSSSSASVPASVSASALGGGGGSRAARQLENRLEKATLKANEAASIRQTYKQVLERLRSEGAQFAPHGRAVEASLKASQAEHSRLLIGSKEAQHAKEQVCA